MIFVFFITTFLGWPLTAIWVFLYTTVSVCAADETNREALDFTRFWVDGYDLINPFSIHANPTVDTDHNYLAANGEAKELYKEP